MKRLYFLAIVALLVLSLCGCGASSADAAIPDVPVDLDLTKLSGTVMYAQVFDMLQEPERYMGQRVRAGGTFNYYRDMNTGREYFAVLIQDATACCAQGLEFKWAGEHKYPIDYPDIDQPITVTGTFSTYEEYGETFVELEDARLEFEFL